MARFGDVAAAARVAALLIEPPAPPDHHEAGGRGACEHGHAPKPAEAGRVGEGRAALEARLLLVERQLRAHHTLIVAARASPGVAEIPGFGDLPKLEPASTEAGSTGRVATMAMAATNARAPAVPPVAVDSTGGAEESPRLPPAKRCKCTADLGCASAQSIQAASTAQATAHSTAEDAAVQRLVASGLVDCRPKEVLPSQHQQGPVPPLAPACEAATPAALPMPLPTALPPPRRQQQEKEDDGGGSDLATGGGGCSLILSSDLAVGDGGGRGALEVGHDRSSATHPSAVHPSAVQCPSRASSPPAAAVEAAVSWALPAPGPPAPQCVHDVPSEHRAAPEVARAAAAEVEGVGAGEEAEWLRRRDDDDEEEEEVPHSKCERVLMCVSGLDESAYAMMKKVGHQVGGAVSKQWTPLVTHVVTVTKPSSHKANEAARQGIRAAMSCGRTQKYLKGVLHGQWIVDLAWVHKSAQVGCGWVRCHMHMHAYVYAGGLLGGRDVLREGRRHCDCGR